MKKESTELFKQNLIFLLKREHMNYSDCDRILGKTSFGYTARLVSPTSKSIPTKEVFDRILMNFGVTRNVMMKEDVSKMSRDVLNSYICMDELELITKDPTYESPFIKAKRINWKTQAEFRCGIIDQVSQGFSGELPDEYTWLDHVKKGYFALIGNNYLIRPLIGVEEIIYGNKRLQIDKSTLKGGLIMSDEKYSVVGVYDSSIEQNPILDEKFDELERQIENSISLREIHNSIARKQKEEKKLDAEPEGNAVKKEENMTSNSVLSTSGSDSSSSTSENDDFDEIFFPDDDYNYGLLETGYFAEYLRKIGVRLETKKQKRRFYDTKDLKDTEDYVVFVNRMNAPDAVKSEICDRIIKKSIKPEWFEAVRLMPYGKEVNTDIDLIKAKKMIDDSHYGMENVKSQIIQLLAVMKSTGKNPGRILCLDGPPGVGKTSIAKAIAKAMGREFVSISGPSLDEGIDVVGDRESYKSAGPGRIAKALMAAGTQNPVILIDEIDKIKPNDSYRSPAPALHEVLDPEQNAFFRDVYLNMPIDLSKVLFILTSNDQDAIIPSLKDRMQIVSLPGYTVDEKFKIAKQYTVPKVAKAVGFGSSVFLVDDAAIEFIVNGYAPEAGVRELERCLFNIASKHITECELKNSYITDLTVRKDDVEKYLGLAKYSSKEMNTNLQVGNAIGLSVSSLTGGEALKVEVITCHGKGELHCTGNLKDVIQESASVAFTYIKKKFENNERYDDFFNKHDFHLHIPGGAIPKDGPSAGITFATAFYSLFVEQPPVSGLAMTGEIDLNGDVLRIGGVKAKLLGAIAAGMTKVILPLENAKDLQDIPYDVKSKLEIHCVSSADEVFAIAFDNDAEENSYFDDYGRVF